MSKVEYFKWRNDHHVTLRNFIERLVSQISRRNTAYARSYRSKDYPLRYNERSMYSLFSSSVSTMTDVMLSELSVGRRSGGSKAVDDEPANGRADLWCHLEGNDVVIELKRVAVGLRNEGQEDIVMVQNAWRTLCLQLENTRDSLAEWAEGFQVGLLVVFPWSQDRAYFDKWEKMKVGQFKDRVRANLDPECKFTAIIPIPKTHQIIDVGNDRDEFTPFVMIAGIFSKI